MDGVVKRYHGLRPLRVTRLSVMAGDRLALLGFDAGAAETFVHLVTGAAVADEGDVRVAGRDTRSIATDTEWLASLDRFGIVTDRAVLLAAMTIAANLALPLTLSIDPIPPDVMHRVGELAVNVGLSADRLNQKAASLSPSERVRVHLARALALNPELLLLEHPTAHLADAAASSDFGATLKRLSDARDLGWIALTQDEAFARASGATRLRLDQATGELKADGFWRAVTRRFS